MVWRLYDPQNGDLIRQPEYSIDLPQDATEYELLAATVEDGWQGFEDVDGANAWKAVVIEGVSNTFVMRWEDEDSDPEFEIENHMADLDILLNTKLRDHSDLWREPYDTACKEIRKALKKGPKSIDRLAEAQAE